MDESTLPDFLKNASPALQNFMARVAPCPGRSAEEDISLTGALMCQIMVLNSVIERNGNRLVENHGLTLPQWLALGCISHSGDEGIPHSQLGHRLMLSKAPITGIVDRLERSGLVERHADTKDRRISRVVATPKGIEAWWQVKTTLKNHSEGVVAASLSSEEQELLLRLMGRLMDAFTPTEDDISSFPLLRGTESEK